MDDTDWPALTKIANELSGHIKRRQELIGLLARLRVPVDHWRLCLYDGVTLDIPTADLIRYAEAEDALVRAAMRRCTDVIAATFGIERLDPQRTRERLEQLARAEAEE